MDRVLDLSQRLGTAGAPESKGLTAARSRDVCLW